MSNRHHRIDYVEFPTPDIAAMKNFYGAVFGWSFSDYGPDYCGINGADGREQGGFARADKVEAGGPLVVLYSEDLDSTLAAVKSSGGAIVQEPFDFPGGRRFHFRDPSGHVVAVWSQS
ncbi:MAG: VOC family protein [Myxococcota bacterium]